LPKVEDFSGHCFSSTGITAMTIILGLKAPYPGDRNFENVDSAKTVTVKVPTGATGYGNIPATYSGSNSLGNWGNAFRGGGGGIWADSPSWQFTNSSYINNNITLHIVNQ
jgi:hypothetical protein